MSASSSFIQVIDSPTSSGKTSWAIHYINSLPEDKKVIFITPFLTEVDRIIASCPEKHFIQPDPKYGSGRKKTHFLKLLRLEKNIVSTHSLFSQITDEMIIALRASNYILVLDEVFSVVEKFDMWDEIPRLSEEDKDELTKNNLKTLFDKKFIAIKEDYQIVWIDQENSLDKYNDLKNLINRNLLYLVNGNLLLWTFPVEVFQEGIFEEIYILTYQFDYQLQSYYYQYFDVKYDLFHIENINNKYTKVKTVNKNYEKEWIKKSKPLVHIFDNPKMNKIGDYVRTASKTTKSALCKNWYESNKGEILRIQKHIINFFMSYTKTTNSERMWTCFVDNKKNMKTKNLSIKNWIALTSRATNDYRNKTALAYPINRYINPFFIAFFEKKNIKLNQNGFALSELIQWIWRSAVRDGKEINVYIPSERMRNMLKDYLNLEFDKWDKDAYFVEENLSKNENLYDF